MEHPDHFACSAKSKGVTLLELVCVLGILLALIVLSFPVYETIRPRVEEMVCINNLRNLHVAFADYATGVWPQVPPEFGIGSVDEQKWWIERAKTDLGLPERVWRCPTIARQFSSAPEKDRPLIHYLPTLFSAEPNKANHWPEMPWFIEIGDAHGRGNLLVRQNGTIEPAAK